MIIYKDIVTGDELLTDAFKIETVDGVFYKVLGKRITVTGDKIDEKVFGGNASAEGGEEEAVGDPEATTGVDVVLNMRLVETGFNTKKEYQTCLKGYMKKVVEKLTESGGDVEAFKKAVGPAVKKVLEDFKDLQFFLGESTNPDGMHVIVKDDGDTILLYFFKDGLEEEKA